MKIKSFVRFLCDLLQPNRTLLSYNELIHLVNTGVINAHLSQVNGSSIDITLASTIRTENCGHPHPVVDLSLKQNIDTKEVALTSEGYILRPNEFILASSIEIFNLPDNISAEYKLKSSMARNGLEHLNAGWCDAWWHGSRLTLELKNVTRFHNLRLRPGMGIGQIVFFKHKAVPKDAGYATRGQYNNDKKVTGSKGIRLGGSNAY